MGYGTKKHRWRLAAAVFLLFAAAWLFWALWPAIGALAARFRDPEAVGRLTAWVESFGSSGIIVLYLLQVAQIVIAFLPGGGIELVGGALYGAAAGVAISLSGIVTGTLIVIWLCQRYGISFARRMFKDERVYGRYQRLGADPKFRGMTVLLFLLPGIPKDVLTYVIGLSGNLSASYIIALTLARVPSVVVSALAGSAFGDGDFVKFGVIYLALGLAALAGMRLNRKVMERGGKNGAPAGEDGGDR